MMRFMTVTEISTKHAARLIGCTEGHVRLLLIQGKIEGRKFNGRAWAVDAESAAEYAKKPPETGRPRSAG